MVQQAMETDSVARAQPRVWRPDFKRPEAAFARVPAIPFDFPSRRPESFVLAQLDLLERINVAASVVGRDERIVRMNRQCERLLGPGLVLQCERLVARHRPSNDRLRKAIRTVFSEHGATQPEPAQDLVTRDPEPPIFYKVLPLGRRCADGLPPYALVVFSSPQLRSIVDAGLLSKAFGLTPAQARLARQVATGASLETVAARLGIKKETVRNHLKQIFLRTGTCRQAELVALLSAFWLAAEDDGQDTGEQQLRFGT